MRPVIALLSDFGTHDHYAGTMKGVMIGICPDVTLIDISHDITPHHVLEGGLPLVAPSRSPRGARRAPSHDTPRHDVLEGALQLAASSRYFPAGTIFLAVVDPGVGSARRGLAAGAGRYARGGPGPG